LTSRLEPSRILRDSMLKVIVSTGVVVLALSAPANAGVSSRLAAALATLPDGTAGVVTVRALDSDSGDIEALHVVRQGSRLTVFDVGTRRYETFQVERSGTRVMVVDRTRSTRVSYIVREAGSRISVLTVVDQAEMIVTSRSSAPIRTMQRPTVVVASTVVSRSLRVDVEGALGDLDDTLVRIQRSPTPADVTALSIVLSPDR